MKTLPAKETVASTVSTLPITVYAVIPGPDTDRGWKVVSFTVSTIPADAHTLHENAARSLAAVYASHEIGRAVLKTEPTYE